MREPTFDALDPVAGTAGRGVPGRRRPRGSRDERRLRTDGGPDVPEGDADGGDPDAPRDGADGGDPDAPRDGADGGDPNVPEDDAAGGDPDVEGLLLSEGIVEEVPEEGDLQLTGAFERAWFERIERIREGDRALRWLAAIRGVDPAEVTVEEAGDPFVVAVEGNRGRAWPSEAAFVAALVAEPTLSEWVPESRWDRLPENARRGLAAQLLIFLETCPSCDRELDLSERNDAGGVLAVSLDCPGCGATVFRGSTQ